MVKTLKITHELDLEPLFSINKPIEIKQNAENLAAAPESPGTPDTPDTNQKQTASETGDYIVRPFRLLSSVILTGSEYPIDYSASGLLQNAVVKFNRTFFTDHWPSMSNALGSVKNARYDSTSTPPGINGDIYVLANPADPLKKDIAKLFADGHLNRCSVTIIFEWEQSHLNMKESEFWSTIGSQVDGQLVRIIATNILQIVEISLVYFGADETAGSLDNSEITKHNSQLQIKKISQKLTNQEVFMDEKLARIKALFKKFLNQEFNTDIEIVSAVESVLNDLAALKTEKQNLENQVLTFQKSKLFEEQVIKTAREEVINLATALKGGLIDTDDKDRYQAAGYEKLLLYKKELENKVPLRCAKCGGVEISRRSSVEIPLAEKTGQKTPEFTAIKMP